LKKFIITILLILPLTGFLFGQTNLKPGKTYKHVLSGEIGLAEFKISSTRGYWLEIRGYHAGFYFNNFGIHGSLISIEHTIQSGYFPEGLSILNCLPFKLTYTPAFGPLKPCELNSYEFVDFYFQAFAEFKLYRRAESADDEDDNTASESWKNLPPVINAGFKMKFLRSLSLECGYKYQFSDYTEFYDKDSSISEIINVTGPYISFGIDLGCAFRELVEK